MTACASCAADNPPGARFCNQCGTRLDAVPAPAASGVYTPRHLRDGALRAASALSGERKRVTVLFADIKGSTRLAAEAGAERWHTVLDRFFVLLGDAVHGHGGTINQYTGDGIMALFGAPLALEEHALCAARAALAMQRAVRRYADELRLEHGLNLSMRVGLNSGEVVVGRIGDDLRSDYTAQGATVSLAARLENLCEPGRIYVSQATAEQIDGYFSLRALGRARLSGFDDEQAIFELEGGGTAPDRLQRSLARSHSPFLGRRAEFERLRERLRSVGGERGAVIAVSGDAGLGKSRLCHEFALACARDGIAVHRCSAVPYARRAPLQPVRELLRSRLGVPPGASDEQARQWIAGAFALMDRDEAALLPHVFDFLGIADETGAMREASAEMQQRLLEQLADYLCCGDAPKVLLIEDLHFVDPATDLFIARLVRAAREAPCLLLLNFRPGYAGAALEAGPIEQLPLQPLPADDLGELARTLLGPDPSLAGVASALVERAGGHPYFVEEAVLALAAGGWLAGLPRAWRLARPIDEWPLPDSVQALLAARVDRLDERPRALLQMAAVIGQSFDAALLAAIDGGADIDARLAALADAGLLFARDGEWHFVHPLLQDVVYRGQLESRRRAVHAELARQLEVRHGPPEPPRELAQRIAQHWRGAGERGRAGVWSLAAARAMVSRNFVTAVDACRLAIADLPRTVEALELRRVGAQARAMLLRLTQFVPTAPDEIEAAYAEAKALLPGDDIAGQIELQMSYGSCLLFRGGVDAAAALHEDALLLALAHDERQIVNRFRVSYLMSFNAAGRLRRILELLDAAGGDWRTRPVDAENFMSRAYYGLMLGAMGRLVEGRRHMLEAIDVAARVQGAVPAWMLSSLVELALLSGDFAPALGAAEAGMVQAEETGSPFIRALALRAMGLALGLNGRYDEARMALREALPLVAPGAVAHLYEANLLATLALAEQEAGACDEAGRVALAACESARRSGSRIWEILARLVWLRLPPRAEAAAEAAAMMTRVAALLDATGAEGFRPWLHLARAQWGDDPDEAPAHIERARAAFIAIGAPAYAASLQPGCAPEPGMAMHAMP